MSEVQKVPTEKLAGFGNVVKGFLQNPPYPLDMDQWAARQTYIALGFFMSCAAMLEIDTLPMEGFVPAKYDEVLDLNSKGYRAVVLCAAGYRAEDDKYADNPKVRYSTNDIVQYVD
jgi:nitroreductase